MFWLAAHEEGLKLDAEMQAPRCGKPAEWRFGMELDFCKEHYDMAAVGLSDEKMAYLKVRTIR